MAGPDSCTNSLIQVIAVNYNNPLSSKDLNNIVQKLLTFLLLIFKAEYHLFEKDLQKKSYLH